VPEIITRAEAREKGLKRYFTGKPCGRGHIAERTVSDSHCCECTRLDAHKRLHDPATRDAEQRRLRVSKAKKRAADPAFRAVEAGRCRARYSANRGAVAVYNAAYRQSPEGKAAGAAAKLRRKRCTPRWTDPEFAKQERAAIREIDKARQPWEHIDHIHPLAGQTYRGPDPAWRGKKISTGLNVSWNLVPALAEDNLSKRATFSQGEFDWRGHALVNGLHG
jgi:hypothetical protein